MQIYEVALYLEVEPTTAELKRLRDAGFFAQVAGLLPHALLLSAARNLPRMVTQRWQSADLKPLEQAGFTEARLIEALGQCASRRALQIRMLRSASYSQFR